MTFRRVFVIDLGAMGIGESPDANRFDSVGADSLGQIDNAMPDRLTLPTLTQLGLGNLRHKNPLKHVTEVEKPLGFLVKSDLLMRTMHLLRDSRAGTSQVRGEQPPLLNTWRFAMSKFC